MAQVIHTKKDKIAQSTRMQNLVHTNSERFLANQVIEQLAKPSLKTW